MIIVQAIRMARTEYVVCFLLSAWLETLVHTGRARILPNEATQLPVRGSRDVSRRLSLIRDRLANDESMAPQSLHVLEDAERALQAARLKLGDLWARATRHPRARQIRRRARAGWALRRGT